MTPSPNPSRTSNLRPSPLSVRIEDNAAMDDMSASSDSPLSRTHSTPVPALSSKLSGMGLRARSFGDLAKKTLTVSSVSYPSPVMPLHGHRVRVNRAASRQLMTS